MKGRILPGVFLATSWVVLLLYGSASIFYLVIIVVLILAADEYVKMSRSKEVCFLWTRFFFCFVLLIPVLSVVFFSGQEAFLFSVLLSFFVLVFWHIIHFSSISPESAESGYLRFTKDVFGLFYIGVMSAHICLLREFPDGAIWILIASAITVSSDTGAYFIGKRFGRRKLCPAVSPKKTVEGAVGGITSAVFAALLFGFGLLSSPQWYFLVIIAVVLSLFGIVGDLTESIIKRGTGVKDSGSCLGGHGGILDRIDSLLFAIPVLYYILLLFPGSM